MYQKYLNLVVAVWLASLAPIAVGAQPAREKYLIRVNKPYDSTVAAIEARGGIVTHRYTNVDAIAAELPAASLPAIRALVGQSAVTKDTEMLVAPPFDASALRGLVPESDGQNIPYESIDELSPQALGELAEINPTAYQANNTTANLTALHAAGFLGQGVIVAVVDSGLRTLSPVHLPGAIVGCEDFIPPDTNECVNAANNTHGTFTAGMVGARVAFAFGAATAFRLAVLAECPACFSNPPTNTVVPMLGTAPLSSIFAFRVLGPGGGGSTSSLLAALDRLIELRQLFNAGDPAGRKIQVANLSLGGSTVFAGRDVLDQMMTALLDNDILPVIAAGNTGPSSLTTASPGSAPAAITVGAASLARNERILRRVQFGAVNGSLYRPFLGTQMANFSGRGPNADGRVDPDVVTNGFASYGFTTGIVLSSGTSNASPSVAGIAAVLRQRFPTATARQIRNAIIAGANPGLLDDGSTDVDRGAGYVDAGAAAALLASGTVPDVFPALPAFNKSVKVNVETNTDLFVRDDIVSETIAALKPGQRYDILYRVHPNVSQVHITVGVTPALPPAEQNQLFGDDVLLTVHSAKTSAIGASGDYPVLQFTKGGSFVVNNPEIGLMRITINGDTTNAGEVGANVAISSVTGAVPGDTTGGTIVNGDDLAFDVTIPAGAKVADFRLEWRADWGNYPTNDLDMILDPPSGPNVVLGATLNNPEKAVIANPVAGTWKVIVSGFEVPTSEDKFKLRVSVDGKVIR